MNEGAVRVRGLEAIREWVSKDDRYITMIVECEIIRNVVDILGMIVPCLSAILLVLSQTVSSTTQRVDALSSKLPIFF